MKVLLINPIIRPESPPAYFPLGLASIAGSLIATGHEVEVLDINAHRWSPAEVQRKLQLTEFDWAGLTGLITEYNQIKWLANIIKSYHPDKPLVLGGGLASSVSDLILEDTVVDISVIGEGEETVIELSRAITGECSLKDVAGIAFRHNGNIYFTEKRPYIKNPDTLPRSAWHLFPVNIYTRGEKLGFEFPVRTINIISGRGCPHSCSYCFHGIFGHKYRARSAKSVVEEILYLKDTYNISGVLFSDDTFTLKKDWVIEFCELLQQYRVNIKWVCNGRVNTVTPELLHLMKKAGCCSIFYGIESGSQRILDRINKGVTVEQAARAIRWSREAGLEVNGYFIIGSPDERYETVKETIDFCCDNNIALGLSIATPLPGTKWLEYAISTGKITDVHNLVSQWACWSDSVIANLSSLSSKEILTLKHWAEELVQASLRKNNSLSSVLQRWGKFKDDYGVRLLILKSLYKLLRSLGLNQEPYTRMQRQAHESKLLWHDIITGKDKSLSLIN
jgi:radical SAM superfamily enzyme YgiQ (UPF0313 family)